MENNSLNLEQSKHLLSVAHGALHDSFSHLPSDGAAVNLPVEKYGGIFVTLMKHGKLRGCMGVFEVITNVLEAVDQVTRQAAFQDPRFAPLTKKELPDLSVEISLLSPLKQVKSVDEIEFGKHGVLFMRGEESGTYLPQVAEEFKNKDQFLNSLCTEKLNLAGECWMDPKVKIFVYTTEVLK